RTVGANSNSGQMRIDEASGNPDRTSEAGESSANMGATALAPGGTAHIDYDALPGMRSGSVSDEFVQAMEARWIQHYTTSTHGQRDITAFSVGTFTWLWDTTPPPDANEPDNRLVAVYGRSAPHNIARDESRIRGWPSPQRDNEQPVHRGHAAAHS